MDWSRLEWPGVGWSGLEWPGVAWSGLERNSIKPVFHITQKVTIKPLIS